MPRKHTCGATKNVSAWLSSQCSAWSWRAASCSGCGFVERRRIVRDLAAQLELELHVGAPTEDHAHRPLSELADHAVLAVPLGLFFGLEGAADQIRNRLGAGTTSDFARPVPRGRVSHLVFHRHVRLHFRRRISHSTAAGPAFSSLTTGSPDEVRSRSRMATQNAETTRLTEDARREKNWKRWGPYLSERQWGTVREDYSPDGDAWDYFPHDHARSRAYRWGEDGLLGHHATASAGCASPLALWNGRDPILKERLFGLTGPEGNHGEDVKEYYFYLDATPTHSYMKALYKYPQAAFPYDRLVEENRRARQGPARVRADRHRRVRRRPLLRRVRRVRQGRARTTSSSASRSPTAGRTRRRCTCCRRCGSATPGRGGARDEGCWPKPRDATAAGRRAASPSTHRWARSGWRAGRIPTAAEPELLFTENETQHAAALRRRRTRAVRQGRVPRVRGRRAKDGRQPATARAPRRRRTTASSIAGRARTRRCGCGCSRGRGAPREPLRRRRSTRHLRRARSQRGRRVLRRR